MRTPRVLVAVMTALALAAGMSVLAAQDPCREKCNAWLAMCKKDCIGAPIVAECEANCKPGYQACLVACEEQ